MERARHERIVLHGVGKHDELGAAEPAARLRPARRRLDDATHPRNGVHVDPGARGGDVDRRANALRHRQCLRNAGDEAAVRLGHALLYERGKPADEIDAERLSRTVKGFGKRHVVHRRRRRRHLRHRGNGHALVDDRNAVLGFDRLARAHKLPRHTRHLVVDLAAGSLRIGVSAIVQRNAHRDRPNVEMLLFDHADGFKNLPLVLHISSPHAWR